MLRGSHYSLSDNRLHFLACCHRASHRHNSLACFTPQQTIRVSTCAEQHFLRTDPRFFCDTRCSFLRKDIPLDLLNFFYGLLIGTEIIC